MSKLVNSSAGNTMFNIAGTALSDAIQPDLDGGAIAGLSTDQIAAPYRGYQPSQENPSLLEYSGTEKIAVHNVVVVTQDGIDINKVYRVRDYKIATAIRNNKLNYSDNTFDTNYPVTGDSTSAIQIAGATPTYPIDDAIGGLDEVVFKYGVSTPTQADLSG